MSRFRSSASLPLVLVLAIPLFLFAGCGDRPSDFLNEDEEETGTGTGDTGGATGAAATCTLNAVTGDTGDITIDFTTEDADGDLVTVFIQFSTNSGATYSLATAAASNTFPNGGTSLNTGANQIFVWDSTVDVGTTQIDVRIRVTIADASNPASNCDSDTFTVNPGMAPAPTPEPPTCAVTSPAAGSMLSDDIPISFTLTDDDNATTADITAEFSTNGGTTFMAATLSAAATENTTGLSTSTTGAPHTFLWDSLTDVPDQDTTPETMVVFRITPTDGDGTGASCTSATFTVDGAAPTNTQPACMIINPSAGVSLAGDVTIDYTLTDQEQTTGDVQVSFSTDGGTTFQAATDAMTAASEGTTGLAMSAAGTMHTFVWDSTTDVPGQQGMMVGNVVVQIVADDGALTGNPCTSGVFMLEAPPALATGSLAVMDGAGTAAFNDTACCGAFASPLVFFAAGETEQLLIQADFNPSPTGVDVTMATSSVGTTAYAIADPSVATVGPDGLVTAVAGGENRCTTLTATFTPNGTTATGAADSQRIAVCVDPGGATNEQRAGPDGMAGTADDVLAVGDMDSGFPGTASGAAIGMGGTFDVTLFVNAGGDSLGAYGLDIMFDNTTLNIDTMTGTMGVSNSMTFPGFTLSANPENPVGRIRINGFDTGTSNTGIFDVCTIHCVSVASGTSNWDVTITDLASNPAAAPIGAATPRLAVAGTGTIVMP